MHRLAARPLVALACLSTSISCSAPAGDAAAPGDTPFDHALAFAAAHPEALFADADTRFEGIAAASDGAEEHVRLARRYKGLRVVGGDVIVHLGGDIAPSLTLRRPLALDVAPGISPKRARRAAAEALGWQDDGADATELVVYARGGAAELAYAIVRRGGSAVAREDHVFVSARDGVVLDRWDAVRSVGPSDGYYSGAVALKPKKKSGVYLLDDAGRGDLATVDAMGGHGEADKLFASGDGAFGNGKLSNRASVAVDAEYAMAQAWDYFAAVHGRKGVDGAGAGIFARVHYGIGLANAFFDPDCGCINLGDGSPDAHGGAMGPLASLDVVAHELSHAVTESSAGLYNSGESGGLNEATSDIFGTMVERRADNPNDPPDYFIGERVRPPKGLRSMAYPEKDGRSTGCWFPGAGKLDPHLSAGIANHFFYLLAEGTGPQTHTCGVKTSFAGIGPDAAAKIWYRALTFYLTADAGFGDARAATIQAASDLHGAASSEVKAVKAAWKAAAVP